MLACSDRESAISVVIDACRMRFAMRVRWAIISPAFFVALSMALTPLAMLINEAADAVQQGVCSEADADTAMKLGVNYPAGPFECEDGAMSITCYRRSTFTPATRCDSTRSTSVEAHRPHWSRRTSSESSTQRGDN